MNRWTNLTALIQQPDALRGLDHLIEHARRVVDRYQRIPVVQPLLTQDPRPLGRTA